LGRKNKKEKFYTAWRKNKKEKFSVDQIIIVMEYFWMVVNTSNCPLAAGTEPGIEDF